MDRVVTLSARRSERPESDVVAAGSCPWSAAVVLVSSVALALTMYVLVQRPAFSEILTLARTARPAPDFWLFPGALISTSLLLLTPSMLLSVGLLMCRRRRASQILFVVFSGIVMTWTLLDVDLLTSVGRHLSEVVELALEPGAHVAGGTLGGWILAVTKWSAVGWLSTALIAGCCQRLVGWISGVLTPLLRLSLLATCVASVSMAMLAPLLLVQAWGNHFLVERLYASCAFDVRPRWGAPDGGQADPRLSELQARLNGAYRSAFAAITAGKLGDARALDLPPNPPNVVLIVTESFRHDVFEPTLMPRLTRWAEAGMVSTHHDSGAVYSQTGAFALLYGRSPAAFHQTLDAGTRPEFCTTLRSSGYVCAYFTGHPKVWLRREEFLNQHTMDRFVHDDRGTWADWDRRALEGMVELATSSPKPVFAIVLLMSSHYEYRYPRQYEVDRPTDAPIWHDSLATSMGPEVEPALRNRYRNCMRFMDDLIADAVGGLDPARNLVIVTGDHGESINDDGHYTHGYSFNEVITRTPFAMVGPGVKPARVDYATLHADVLPSVVHVLTGRHREIAHVQGIDWFAGERHAALLESDSPLTKHVIKTQLRAGGRHLRLDLDLTRPSVTMLGFEDALGRLQSTPDLTQAEVEALATAFDAELGVLRR